jgi:hypothetical protein
MCVNNKNCGCQVTVTACAVVEVLNRALEADPDAINELFDYHVPCNDKLAGDPAVQVKVEYGLSGYRVWCNDKLARDSAVKVKVEYKFAGPKQTIGILGLINGLLGVDENGWGYVRAVYDTVQKKIVMFELSEKTFKKKKKSMATGKKIQGPFKVKVYDENGIIITEVETAESPILSIPGHGTMAMCEGVQRPLPRSSPSEALRRIETCCFDWCQAPATVTVRNRDNEEHKACKNHAEVVQSSGGLKTL